MSAEQNLSRPIDEEAWRQFSLAMVPAQTRWQLHQDFASVPIGIPDPEEPGKTKYGIEGEMMMQLELKGDESILDCACGIGRFICRLVKEMGHTGSIVGVDNSEAAVDVAAAETVNYPNVSIFQSDIRNLRQPDGLPIPDESFDIIVTAFTLYHVDDYEKGLAELYSKLKPGGRMLIATRELDHQAKLWMLTTKVAEDLKRRVEVGEEVEQEGEVKYVKLPLGRLLHVDRDSEEARRLDEVAEQGDFDIIPPEPFYEHFDFEKSRQAATKLFPDGPIDSFRQIDIALLELGEWDLYALALLDLYLSYQIEVNGERQLIKSGGGRVAESIDVVVKNEFEEQVRQDGYFIEYIRQGFDIYQKPETA